jgi:uncharacterized membrane protein
MFQVFSAYGPARGHAHWALMLVGLVLLIAIVAAAIYAIVRYVESSRTRLVTPAGQSSGSSAPVVSDSAESTLRMRLATGEISEDEFRSRWSALHIA